MGTLILASGSPRRRELLQLICREFQVVISEIEEQLPASFSEEIKQINAQTAFSDKLNIFGESAMYLAEQKANAVVQLHPTSTVLGADTLVVAKGEILGKPNSKKQAREMLCALSGNTHSAITGICLMNNKCTQKFYSETLVTFRELTKEEIEAYICTKEPYDKAGSYGIQGQAARFIKRIEGSYTNVVGLDITAVKEKLLEYKQRETTNAPLM